MAIFCIPRQYIDALQKSALKDNVNLKELYEMDSKTRRQFFSKFTDKQVGQFINTKFEQAMVSKQQEAMLDWAKSVFTPSEKKQPRYKNVLDKIANLQDLGVLNQRAENAFLEDLVTEKLGISLTPEEMQNITEKATKVEEAQKVLGDDMGNPAKIKENVAYFKAVKEINDYMQSVSPASEVAIAMGTIGRGMMLASVKSPLLNIVSNMEVGITEGIARRLATGKVKGTDNKLALEYIKMAREIYKETGFDITRMRNASDLGAAGKRILGDTVHTQGPGAIRKAGRAVEGIVFKNLMGAPDAAFASAHFVDSINLQSLAMANGDTVQAKQLMEDAMRIAPITDAGKLLRAQAVMDAEVATWTNDTRLSRTSTKIRKLLNDISANTPVGDLRLGDYLMPFVKTPANVISTGLDYAGLGTVKGLVKLVDAYRHGKLDDVATVQNLAKDLVRGGMGLLAAMVLAMNTDDDDYVGAYDPSRAQNETLRNSVENSVRVGNVWISTDWFGPLAVPYNAIMHAKKYGKVGAGESVFQYGAGAASSIMDLPGVDLGIGAAKAGTQQQDATLGEMAGKAGDYLISEASARLVPSIVGDIAKAVDPSQRKTTNALEAAQAKVPGLRNLLSEKRNIFGDVIPADNPAIAILFGSRVRTSREDAIVREMHSVMSEVDKGITFMDWDKTSSKKLAQFKERFGDATYKEATIQYGRILRDNIAELMQSPKYQDMTVEQKLNAINGLDTDAMEAIFKKYRFTYTKQKKE